MKIQTDYKRIHERRIEIFGDERGARTEAMRAARMRSIQQWDQIETGERRSLTVDVLYRVARALRCKMDDLIEVKE